MNEKLKQSLDARLGGMRWGGREQAEVFRLIRRKETQDVKQIRRGSGMLAIAMALLFIVMGAAFALTTQNPPEDNRLASQTGEPTFIPVALARYENEDFVLTIDSVACADAETAFTATLRMKSPAKYMLRLDGHTTPGDPARTPYPVTMSAAVSTTLPGSVRMAMGDLRTLDVLEMTEASAVFSMRGATPGVGRDSAISVWITWTDPRSGNECTGQFLVPVSGPTEGVLLLQGPYLNATLGDCAPGVINVALTPAKPWYVLNRQEEGKTTLTVYGERMTLYPGEGADSVLTQVEHRTPGVGEMTATLTPTPDGIQMQLTGEIPAGHDMLYGYIALSVHSDVDGLRYAEILVPIPVEAVQPTPAPMPASPTPTPAPMPASGEDVARDIIHENEYVVITRESAWYDGLSASIRLRATLKDPDACAFVASGDSPPADGRHGISLTAMIGYSDEAFSRNGWMTLAQPWQLDDSLMLQGSCYNTGDCGDPLYIGGFLWLNTPWGEETIALNLTIPQTGLWREYALTPVEPAQTIRLEGAALHAGTHASYYDLDYVLQDSEAPLTIRLISVNDAPLTICTANTADTDGLFSTTIVAQTRLTPQTAIFQVCTADGQVMEEILCQIEEVSNP